tara:strand:+ start:733 stop:861 length:129 start_codon:yes stop_codon:yes gene_type:complete
MVIVLAALAMSWVSAGTAANVFRQMAARARVAGVTLKMNIQV